MKFIVKNATEINEKKDKYGVTNLKLEAEVHYVESIKFNLENIGDCLLFSESKNCALLKEAVMNFIVENASEINEKNSLKDVHGDFLNDALAVLAIKEEKRQAVETYSERFSVMTINELRHEAHENGLEVDGTREMLISALKDHYNNASGLDDDFNDDSMEDDSTEDHELGDDESEDDGLNHLGIEDDEPEDDVLDDLGIEDDEP